MYSHASAKSASISSSSATASSYAVVPSSMPSISFFFAAMESVNSATNCLTSSSVMVSGPGAASIAVHCRTGSLYSNLSPFAATAVILTSLTYHCEPIASSWPLDGSNVHPTLFIVMSCSCTSLIIQTSVLQICHVLVSEVIVTSFLFRNIVDSGTSPM